MKIKTIKLNKNILQNQKIELVIVFGSKVTGFSHSKSDLDIGIVFFDKIRKKEKPVEVYGVLYEEFIKKFKTENIDIVYLEEAPLSLQYKAVRDGIVLYEDSPVSFADYKENILKKYFDFKYFENIFNQAIIKPA